MDRRLASGEDLRAHRRREADDPNKLSVRVDEYEERNSKKKAALEVGVGEVRN
jgi:hypothetical protein